jgi:hypothetical protein
MLLKKNSKSHCLSFRHRRDTYGRGITWMSEQTQIDHTIAKTKALLEKAENFQNVFKSFCADKNEVMLRLCRLNKKEYKKYLKDVI